MSNDELAWVSPASPRPQRRARPRLWLAWGLIVVTVGPAAMGFRDDEIQCEETAARIGSCCETTDLRCSFVEGCEHDQFPDLNVSESECLRELSCDELKQYGVCDYDFAVDREQAPSRPWDVVCGS
jgi:hypothetical protein